ncbi:hypothetical protein [uncultured Roseibium sp.]|uniref:CAF17-like 4Fe-4S cluster assembly/insertion protein YgfZ n=1 Tax=uncultured Roseibium sp. TaxID=1936171 RepID=UPI003217C691
MPAGTARLRKICPAFKPRTPGVPALGWRLIGEAKVIKPALEAGGFAEATDADYAAHRIALGVPEGLADYAYSDVFPHDADMDQLGGVSFSKGCYVGQEVGFPCPPPRHGAQADHPDFERRPSARCRNRDHGGRQDGWHARFQRP